MIPTTVCSLTKEIMYFPDFFKEASIEKIVIQRYVSIIYPLIIKVKTHAALHTLWAYNIQFPAVVKRKLLTTPSHVLNEVRRAQMGSLYRILRFYPRLR